MQIESVAIVTGSSTGNGFETSLLLAKNENLPLEVLELDVTDDKSVANAIDIIGNTHQRIDVLVNNAGYEHHGAVE